MIAIELDIKIVGGGPKGPLKFKPVAGRSHKLVSREVREWLRAAREAALARSSD